MDAVRSGWVNPKGGPTPREAYGVQGGASPSSVPAEASTTSGDGSVWSLETPSRTVSLNSLNRTTIKLQNTFDALYQDDDESDNFSARVGPDTTPEDVCLNGWVPVPGKRWPKKAKARTELNSVERKEIVQVNNLDHSQYLEVTVDSGAAENVMPKHMAPRIPLEPSDEQASGVVYSAANGNLMPNRGKKSVPVITREGQSRQMNMQITDVNKALMSVAKVCDAGHTVLFMKGGGVIRNTKSGEETTFRSEKNVYRMRVKLNGASFQRQG